MNISSPSQTMLVVLLGASQHPNYPKLNSKFGDSVVWERAFRQAAEKLQVYFAREVKLPHENLLLLFDDPELPLKTYEKIRDHLKNLKIMSQTLLCISLDMGKY